MHPEPLREPELNKLLRMVRKYHAYVMYLKVGEPPIIRLRGEIRRMEMRALTQGDLERLLDPIMDDQQRRSLDETGMAFFAHVLGKREGGFACTVSKEDGQLGLAACLLEGPDPEGSL
jgi:twitching motility protein PilT